MKVKAVWKGGPCVEEAEFESIQDAMDWLDGRFKDKEANGSNGDSGLSHGQIYESEGRWKQVYKYYPDGRLVQTGP